MAPDVVSIGAEKMRMARKGMRLSAEETARRMTRNGFKRGTRTYERWEREGEVPREALPFLAPVLGLDLEKILIDQPTRVQWQQVSDVLADVRDAVQGLVHLLDEQRQVVERLETVAAALQQREAAN